MSHLVSVIDYTAENIGDLAANARALRAKLYAPAPRIHRVAEPAPAPEPVKPAQPVVIDALAQYRLAYSTSIPASSAMQVAKRIKAEAAAEAGLTVALIEGETRTANIVRARHLAMWRIAKATALSLQGIGRLFGNRDHTTVILAVRRMNDEFGENVRGTGGVRGVKVFSWAKAKAAGKSQ